jgi:hypothetical protein
LCGTYIQLLFDVIHYGEWVSDKMGTMSITYDLHYDVTLLQEPYLASYRQFWLNDRTIN